jgi:transposase
MKAYSKDLPQKIVDALKRGMPKAQAARTFGIGLDSQAFRRQGPKGRIPAARHKAPGKHSKMDEQVKKILEEDLTRYARLSPSASAATM